MKTMNFWRTLFFSALAVTAFTGCKDDDKATGGDESRATITVDGKSAVALGVKAQADLTVDVKVVSSGEWVLTYSDTTPDWLEVSAVEGKAGESTVTFTVKDALPAGMDSRSAMAKFQTRGFIMGAEYWATATVTITQSESGSPVGNTNVAQIRTLLKAMNPTENKMDVTADIAAMTIRGVVVSEAEGKNWGTTKNIAIQDFEGAANSGLTLNASTFEALALKAGTVVSVPLAGAQVQLYKGLLQLAVSNSAEVATSTGVAPEPVVVTPSQLADYESMLIQIDECYAAAGYNTAWYDAEGTKGNTNFTTHTGETFVCRVASGASFASALIPEKAGSLIGIAGCYNTTMQVSPRVLSDIRLTEAIPAPEYKTATIAEITAAGNFKVENATVIANYAAGFLMQDASNAIILVYPGEGATIPAAGKVVTVEGTVSVYGDVLQFGNGTKITETSDGTVPAPGEAVEITADNIGELMTSPKVTYVKMTGNFSIDKTYRNLTFLFETNYKGSIVAPATEGAYDPYNGKLVDITGWFLNNANGTTYLSILVTDIKENTTIPVLTFTSVPQSFAATAPATQTLSYTVQNQPEGSLVNFAFTGDDAAMFQVEGQDDSAHTVTIKAVGDNSSSADYAATLTASIDGTVLDEVHVRQLAPAGSDTRGTYTSMSIFVSNGASNANPAGISGSKVGEAAADGFKIGTAKKVGSFTSGALGVTGSKKLGFYAVGWSGKSNVPLKITVNGGGSASETTFTLNGNAGASGTTTAFTLTPTDNDYFVTELSDLTAASTITFETTDAGNGRAVVFGVQLFD